MYISRTALRMVGGASAPATWPSPRAGYCGAGYSGAGYCGDAYCGAGYCGDAYCGDAYCGDRSCCGLSTASGPAACAWYEPVGGSCKYGGLAGYWEFCWGWGCQPGP